MKKKFNFFWLNPKIVVRNTRNCGEGLHAKEKIKKDEMLLVCGGYVMKLSEEEKLPGKCSDNGVQIYDDLVLSISKPSEYSGFNYFNHSCEPNAGIKGQIFFVAMRDIKKDEHIAFDYAMTLCKSKNAKPYKLHCLCGSKNCRKIITDEDWKIPELQKKYKGYFQYYIQEKINKIKK